MSHMVKEGLFTEAMKARPGPVAEEVLVPAT